MGLLLKGALGASAIYSAIVVGASQRDNPPPPQMAMPAPGPHVVTENFDQRWPGPIGVEPVKEIAPQPSPDPAPERIRQSYNKHRSSCHRVYFTRNHHRYWSCRK
jgi:hypothetical protein